MVGGEIGFFRFFFCDDARRVMMRMAEFVGELVRRQRQTGAASEAWKPTSTQKGFDGFCLSYSPLLLDDKNQDVEADGDEEGVGKPETEALPGREWCWDLLFNWVGNGYGVGEGDVDGVVVEAVAVLGGDVGMPTVDEDGVATLFFHDGIAEHRTEVNGIALKVVDVDGVVDGVLDGDGARGGAGTEE